jgi:hypothetical protein
MGPKVSTPSGVTRSSDPPCKYAFMVSMRSIRLQAVRPEIQELYDATTFC